MVFGLQRHVIYQGLGAASVGMTGLVSSIAMGYTSPALPSMRQDPQFDVKPDDESWIGAVMPASALVGSLMAGPLLDNFGRRFTILYFSVPFMISWSLIAIAGNVSGVILGRMLSGICVGLYAVSGSVFMPETIQLDLRNIMMCFPNLFGNLGILVSYAAGSYLSWRGLAWLASFLCLPQIIFLLPLKETPFFLTKTGKRDLSVDALKTIRLTTQEAEKEQSKIDEICSRTEETKSVISSLSGLIQPPNLWPISVGAALMIAQQTTGINAVIFYSSAIFEAGGDSIDPSTGSTILGIVNLLGVFISMYCIGTFKRRQLLLISTSIVVSSLLILSAFFAAQEMGDTFSAITKQFSLVPAIGLFVYIGGFALGWGPIPWVFLGEGMPSNVRGLAAAFVVALSWGSTFAVTKTFQWTTSLLGNHNTFLSYAIITAISSFIIHRNMPETYGKSGVEMDEIYVKASKKKQQ